MLCVPLLQNHYCTESLPSPLLLVQRDDLEQHFLKGLVEHASEAVAIPPSVGASGLLPGHCSPASIPPLLLCVTLGYSPGFPGPQFGHLYAVGHSENPK